MFWIWTNIQRRLGSRHACLQFAEMFLNCDHLEIYLFQLFSTLQNDEIPINFNRIVSCLRGSFLSIWFIFESNTKMSEACIVWCLWTQPILLSNLRVSHEMFKKFKRFLIFAIFPVDLEAQHAYLAATLDVSVKQDTSWTLLMENASGQRTVNLRCNKVSANWIKILLFYKTFIFFQTIWA